jgi:2-iminobutanoate/2-iminopropanoate deaminase
VRAGGLVHIAGTVATDAGGKIIPGDIQAQTRKTLENVGAILKAAGLDFQDVVAVNVYLTDVRNFEGMAQAYRETFKSNPPVLGIIEAGLPLQGSLIEVSGIAADRGLPRQIVRPAGWADNPLYSRAIKVGDYIFLAGLVAEDAKTGKSAGGDTRAQTRQILDNAKALVEGAGLTLADLTVARAWLADGRESAQMNEVYRTYFGETPPTRATVQAKLVAPQHRVGLMFSGVRGTKQRQGEVGGAPLSPAIRVGNTLYIAGLVQGGAEVRGDIRAQTRGVLTQIQNHLKQAGMDFANAVSATVWLTNVGNFGPMNEVYNEFFKSEPPARATVGTGLLPVDGLVEIAVLATK